jgi:hypothetical protein
METINEKKYPIIYVDAPWEDKTWPIKRVKELPVGKRSAADALLLLWMPVALLPDALVVLKGWEFEYAGLLTWQKPNDDKYWHRSRGEHMLIGKRGIVKTSFLFRHTIFEESPCDGDFKPEGFRHHLLMAGLIAFGESAPHLDLFGGYWKRFFPGYEKDDWDFWED